MDKHNSTITQLIDFPGADTIPAASEAGNDVRTLEDSELAYAGGGDNIPAW